MTNLQFLHGYQCHQRYKPRLNHQGQYGEQGQGEVPI